MSWTELSVVSEILGSLAIVITLIYLAIQTRQNADATLANTRQELLAADQQLLLQFIQDSELELIRYKPELTEREKARLGWVFVTFTRMRENNWLQYQNGVLDKETWESYRGSIVAMFGNLRGKTWWQNYVVDFGLADPRFASEVSELLASAPTRDRSSILAAFD